MAETRKIAISIPEALAKKVESLRRLTGESRSAFISRAIERVLREREQKSRVALYQEGYRKHPESREEIAFAESSAARLLAEEPWE